MKTAATGMIAKMMSSSRRAASELLSADVKKSTPMIIATNPKSVKADTRTNIDVKLPERSIDQCFRNCRAMMIFRTTIEIASITSRAEVTWPGAWSSKLQYETEENLASGMLRLMTVDSRIKTTKIAYGIIKRTIRQYRSPLIVCPESVVLTLNKS